MMRQDLGTTAFLPSPWSQHPPWFKKEVLLATESTEEMEDNVEETWSILETTVPLRRRQYPTRPAPSVKCVGLTLLRACRSDPAPRV